MSRRILTSIALAAAVLASVPALAGQPEGAVRAVSYADLDLSTAHGVATLHRRIAGALEAVCGSYAGTDTSSGVEENDAITRCRANARTQADQRVAALVSNKVQVAAR